MIIIYLILIFALALLNFFKGKKSLHMLQQNLYNENNRYLKWVMKNKKQFLYLDLIMVIISLVGVFVIYDLEAVSIACLAVISVLSDSKQTCKLSLIPETEQKK